MQYEAVIGMEIHAELKTESKLFCACSAAFGAEPNAHTCPVCLGMPGTLPVMNRAAFDHAVKAAVALNCRVARRLHFDRKNYYYPDLPKNYQISQLYENIGTDGWLEIPLGGEYKRVGIWNVHLEEDAGKLLHSDSPGEDYSLVDLNRAGVPLLEIVSAPDMRTCEEAEAYMKTVRNLLLCLGVSDCKIEEGSLRFEAGVSVRPKGEGAFGPRAEIKNLGSITAVLRAVEYEIARQTKTLEAGGQNEQETRLWNDALRRTERMRGKEHAHDYRYFPEPDLAPFSIAEERLEAMQAEIPELPVPRRQRFEREMGLSGYDAGVLTEDRALADYFEATAAECGSPKAAANWVANTVMGHLNEQRAAVADFPLPPAALAELVRIVENGTISVAVGREVFAEMLQSGASASQIVESKGLAQISDESALEEIVRRVVDQASEKILQDWKDGKQKALNALIGPVMRETKGKANPRVVKELLERTLREVS